MKSLVPWVRSELLLHLSDFGHGEVTCVENVHPLSIESSIGTLSNFKEVWNPENCSKAFDSAAMYEAGANLTWLDLSFVGEFEALLHAEPEWKTVLAFVDQFFSRRPAPAAESEGLGRIAFPCVLTAYSGSDGGVSLNEMPKHLKLLGGQAIVFAWLLAAARALQSSDKELLKMLWQAALTCTVRLYSTIAPKDLAVQSLELSEQQQSLAQMTDTFVHWSKKVMFILEKDGILKGSVQVLVLMWGQD